MTPDSVRWFGAAYALWLLGIFGYFMPASTWNPVSRFDLTRAIVEEHSLTIDDYVDNTGDRARFDGIWRTDKAPIPSLLAVPVYAVVHLGDLARGTRPAYSVFSTRDLPATRVVPNAAFQRALYACSLATAGAAGALGAALLFEMLRRRFSPESALVGSTVAFLCTPMFPYATSFYGHGIAGFFLIAALWALARDAGAAPRRADLRIAGACLVLAVGSEYITAVPGVVFAGLAIALSPKGTRLRAVLDLFSGALAPAVVIAAYHQVCFGAPWRTGYSFIQRAEFARGHASGFLGVHAPKLAAVYGISFGENRGLFLLSPVALLAFALLGVRAAKVRDPGARAGLAAFVVLLLANAGYYMWWGGAATGPRHLVPAMGFLAFGAAAAWQSPKLRWVLSLLAIVSFANMLVLTAVGLEGPEHGNLLVDYGYRRFFHGDIAHLPGASNLALKLGMVRAGSLGPLLVWVLLGGRYLLRAVRREESTEEAHDDATRSTEASP